MRDRLSMSGAAVAWAVLASALLFTFAVTFYVRHTIGQEDLARFHNAVQSAQDLIGRRLDVYQATLESGAALWAVTDTVTAQQFETYVARLNLQERYPGIQGIGWSERISRLDSGGEAEPDERHSIRYLEPLDARNRAALGYDMYSEATRREAMARARDTGQPALSGKVRLVQEIYGREQAGFLLYVPVYRGGAPDEPTTVEARRETLEGFVYSPFRADDLFAGIFGSEVRPRVSFRVYDGPSVHPDALIHTSGSPADDPRWLATRSLLESGREWTVVFESTEAFEGSAAAGMPWAVLLSGIAASLWLFLLARGQARARARAEAANRAKSTFLATMSHELRTPLNAIAGYVDLLEVEVAGKVNPEQRTYLERIRVAQGHLLSLIEDVLHLAKLEAGRVQFRSEPVRVPDIVRDTVSLVSSQISDREMEYREVGGAPATALADQEKVRQILLNLLTNAVKFTPAGGSIEVGWEATDGEVQISVADSGVGVEADQMESIFEPFFQVEADLTRTTHGTGLGLAISRDLARDMDGDLVVARRPDGGSRFTLTLPRHTTDGG